MNIPILVDGANFINRILEQDINARHVAKQLSMVALREHLTDALKATPKIIGEPDIVEFFCSPRAFGPQKSKFTPEQQTTLLDRLRAETGVHVETIAISGQKEKGVDIAVSSRLLECEGAPAVILVTSDTDYIPAIKKLRHKTKVVLVSIENSAPSELQNEAYTTIHLGEDLYEIFEYRPARYAAAEFTEEICAEMISNGDDRVHNQIRVTYDGEVYLSRETSAQSLNNVKFRFETFCARNGYVGPRAASTQFHVRDYTKQILDGWKLNAKGYFDYDVASVWGKSQE